MNTDIQAMFDAVLNGNTDAIKGMLANGADINAADNDGTTPLHLAAMDLQPAVAQMLLECGADPNARESDGRTALRYAVDPNLFFPSPEGPRFKAARAVITRMLLEHGADPNAEADDGTTPLGSAVAELDAESVKLLLEHGADATRYGGKRNAEKILVRLAKPSYLDQEDPWDNSPPANDRIFQLLLEHGWEFDAKLLANRLYLAEAVQGDLRHMAAFLLRHGADANEPAGYRHADELAAFLPEEYAESWESQDAADYSRSVLHEAAALQQPDIAALLLDHGANPNATDAKRETPLHVSVRSGRWPITKLLLQHGADPYAKDKSGVSPLDLEEDEDLQALMRKHGPALP